MRSLPNVIEHNKAKKREKETETERGGRGGRYKEYLSLHISSPLLIFLDEYEIRLSLLKGIEGVYRAVTIEMERPTWKTEVVMKFSPRGIQNALTSCRASPQMITLRVMTMQFVSIKSKTTNIIASILVSAITSPLFRARNTCIDKYRVTLKSLASRELRFFFSPSTTR